MKTSAWVPWGKLARLADGSVAIHPLLDHMTDVSSVLQALLDTPGIRRAATCAAGRQMEAVDIERLCVLGFLHDIGKANAGFQARYWDQARPPGWTVPPCGHGPQGWAVISGEGLPARIRESLPIGEMAAWGAEACYALLHASISHHGRPVVADESDVVAPRRIRRPDALRPSRGVGTHQCRRQAAVSAGVWRLHGGTARHSRVHAPVRRVGATCRLAGLRHPPRVLSVQPAGRKPR